MAKGIVHGQGGLSSAEKALLIPENLREGVEIAGVVGTAKPYPRFIRQEIHRINGQNIDATPRLSGLKGAELIYIPPGANIINWTLGPWSHPQYPLSSGGMGDFYETTTQGNYAYGEPFAGSSANKGRLSFEMDGKCYSLPYNSYYTKAYLVPFSIIKEGDDVYLTMAPLTDGVTSGRATRTPLPRVRMFTVKDAKNKPIRLVLETNGPLINRIKLYKNGYLNLYE